MARARVGPGWGWPPAPGLPIIRRMALRIVQVDAFTSEPFAGNPAAVCVLDDRGPHATQVAWGEGHRGPDETHVAWGEGAPRDERWMQDIARELNLSETAFLVREGDVVFHLRWFTPATEVDLCGHATLASAHVLWEDGHLEPGETARFRTRSGRLTAAREDGWITMDFPAEPAAPVDAPAALIDALGIASITGAARNRMDDLVEVESEAAVRALRPDMTRLRELTRRGVIVTARAADPAYDFVSRFFAPAVGVGEDPVTGSAHCCLGPYWRARLGKSELVGFQASARGGTVRVRCAGDRVFLSGQAVTVLRGELVPPASGRVGAGIRQDAATPPAG